MKEFWAVSKIWTLHFLMHSLRVYNSYTITILLKLGQTPIIEDVNLEAALLHYIASSSIIPNLSSIIISNRQTIIVVLIMVHFYHV